MPSVCLARFYFSVCCCLFLLLLYFSLALLQLAVGRVIAGKKAAQMSFCPSIRMKTPPPGGPRDVHGFHLKPMSVFISSRKERKKGCPQNPLIPETPTFINIEYVAIYRNSLFNVLKCKYLQKFIKMYAT